jgi:hypothetical protein
MTHYQKTMSLVMNSKKPIVNFKWKEFRCVNNQRWCFIIFESLTEQLAEKV